MIDESPVGVRRDRSPDLLALLQPLDRLPHTPLGVELVDSSAALQSQDLARVGRHGAARRTFPVRELLLNRFLDRCFGELVEVVECHGLPHAGLRGAQDTRLAHVEA